MEGGNGASNGRGITHSPLGEQTAARHAYQIDEAENLPRMDSALGVHLDGVAVKEKRKPPKVLRTWKTASPRWFADVSSAPVGGEANPRCRARRIETAPVGRRRGAAPSPRYRARRIETAPSPRYRARRIETAPVGRFLS